MRLELEEAIAALTPALRTVFVLRAVEGDSHEEIASLLSLRRGTIEVRYFRAVSMDPNESRARTGNGHGRPRSGSGDPLHPHRHGWRDLHTTPALCTWQPALHPLWYAGRLDQSRGLYALKRFDFTMSPDGVTVPPGEPLAILPLASGAVGVAYTELTVPAGQRPTVDRWLDVYNAAGALVARGKIPFADVTSISSARAGRHVWLALQDPYPQVVKFQIAY